MTNKINKGFNRQVELSNCSFVKTILMLIVVAYHSVLYWGGNWFVGSPVFSAPVFPVIAQWMNSFHIYAFVLVSGYLFFYLKYEKGKYDKFLPFVINKCKRLLIPYAFISIIWAIPFAVYFSKNNVIDIILKFGLGTSPHQLWFLLMLFDVFVMFYPLSAFYKKNDLGGAALIIAFYGFGFVGQILFPNIFQIFSACMYVPLFWIGFKIRQYGSVKLRKIPVIVWIVVDILLFVLTRIVAKMDGIFFLLLRQGISFLLHIVGALMAFVILQKLAERIRWKESKVFNHLSQNSMTIYMLHQQVIYVFIVILNGVVNPYVHVIVNFIGAIAISLLISTLLMKFKLTKILIGEK